MKYVSNESTLFHELVEKHCLSTVVTNAILKLILAPDFKIEKLAPSVHLLRAVQNASMAKVVSLVSIIGVPIFFFSQEMHVHEMETLGGTKVYYHTSPLFFPLVFSSCFFFFFLSEK